MDAEWKARWLEALRSGRYKQGHDQLRTEHDEFCCLGVLCDLVAPEAWYGPPGGWAMFNDDGGALPKEVADAVGLNASNPRIGEHSATYLNDGFQGTDEPKSFPEIADLIERYL